MEEKAEVNLWKIISGMVMKQNSLTVKTTNLYLKHTQHT